MNILDPPWVLYDQCNRYSIEDGSTMRVDTQKSLKSLPRFVSAPISDKPHPPLTPPGALHTASITNQSESPPLPVFEALVVADAEEPLGSSQKDMAWSAAVAAVEEVVAVVAAEVGKWDMERLIEVDVEVIVRDAGLERSRRRVAVVVAAVEAVEKTVEGVNVIEMASGLAEVVVDTVVDVKTVLVVVVAEFVKVQVVVVEAAADNTFDNLVTRWRMCDAEMAALEAVGRAGIEAEVEFQAEVEDTTAGAVEVASVDVVAVAG